MAYVKPTYADFVARFPVFGDYEQTQIDAVLEEACGVVDTTWREADYKPAIMYLTAHLLSTDASQEDDLIDDGSPQDISSESFGGMSISYGSKSSPAGGDALSGDYSGTEYGRRFLRMLRGNFPPIVVV